MIIVLDFNKKSLDQRQKKTLYTDFHGTERAPNLFSILNHVLAQEHQEVLSPKNANSLFPRIFICMFLYCSMAVSRAGRFLFFFR